MATSGILNTTAYDSRYLEFAWTRTTYSIENNTSTISWTLTARGKGQNSWINGNGWLVKIDGDIEYESNTVITTKQDMLITSGTKVINHNTDGTKNFTVYVKSNLWVADSAIGTKSFTLDAIPRKASLLTATSFNDEENPLITFSNPAGNSVTSIVAYIKDTSGNALVTRTLTNKTATTYTFTLTDAERVKLRKYVKSGYSAAVRFVLTTTIGSYTGDSAPIEKILTLVNAEPVVTSAKVTDNNPDTTALTGNAHTIIKGFSTAYYEIEAEARKEATIVSYEVVCGGDKETGAVNSFLNAKDNLFFYTVTDSRGNTATGTVNKQEIDYIKVTCNQKVDIEIVQEAEAKATVTLNGNYFNDTFGNVDNELRLEVRYKVGSGSYGNWIPVTEAYTPTYTDTTYTLKVPFAGLDYSQPHTFECRATDKLTQDYSGEYTARLIPVFDWSNTDFNFNVPVSINGIELDYIIEQGDKDGWYYRKWNSGRAECWKRLTVSTAINYVWQGNMYVSASIERQRYPVDFITTPIENVTIQAGANAVFLICDSAGNGANGTHSSAQYKIVRAASATTTASTYYLSYNISGYWR